MGRIGRNRTNKKGPLPLSGWDRKIQKLEKEYGRKICGGRRQSDGMPCDNEPIQGKTRCMVHGGLSTGAPRGNENAVRHGIYKTRLSPVERAEYESLFIEFANVHKIDLARPSKRIMLSELCMFVVLQRRCDVFITKEGVAVVDEYKDHSVWKANPVLHYSMRLTERIHELMVALNIEAETASMVAASGGMDPMSRDSLVAFFFSSESGLDPGSAFKAVAALRAKVGGR